MGQPCRQELSLKPLPAIPTKTNIITVQPTCASWLLSLGRKKQLTNCLSSFRRGVGGRSVVTFLVSNLSITPDFVNSNLIF